jgi:Fe-S-cluster containining protein
MRFGHERKFMMRCIESAMESGLPAHAQTGEESPLTEAEIRLIAPMNCRRCGLCCSVIDVQLTRADLDREPRLKEYAVPLSETEKREIENAIFRLKKRPSDYYHVGSGHCPFFSCNICKIYPTRPQLCRDLCPTPLECHTMQLKAYGISIKELLGIMIERSVPENLWAVRLMMIDCKKIKQMRRKKQHIDIAKLLTSENMLIK